MNVKSRKNIDCSAHQISSSKANSFKNRSTRSELMFVSCVHYHLRPSFVIHEAIVFAQREGGNFTEGKSTLEKGGENCLKIINNKS